ncbi:MAG: hypothetical protein Q8O87_02870 [bacterium]|nr:hypothetical protein [bacterium]
MDTKVYEEKLKKLEIELSEESKKLGTTPEMGSDVDSYDTETDEAEEFANSLGVKESIKNRLAAVRKALGKITDGSYGRCENCQNDIPKEVLDISPESNLCKNCKSTSA